MRQLVTWTLFKIKQLPTKSLKTHFQMLTMTPLQLHQVLLLNLESLMTLVPKRFQADQQPPRLFHGH